MSVTMTMTYYDYDCFFLPSFLFLNFFGHLSAQKKRHGVVDKDLSHTVIISVFYDILSCSLSLPCCASGSLFHTFSLWTVGNAPIAAITWLWIFPVALEVLWLHQECLKSMCLARLKMEHDDSCGQVRVVNSCSFVNPSCPFFGASYRTASYSRVDIHVVGSGSRIV